MTSNIGITALLGKADDSALKGIRRSRFSLHMRTYRVRRWLLVQFVSLPVPVEEAHEDKVGKAVQAAQRQERLRSGVEKVRNDYQMAWPAGIWA